MSNFIDVAQNFSDLETMGLDMTKPYRFDHIFGLKGLGTKSLSKKKFKLIKQLDVPVRDMLEEGEEVHCISWGMEYCFVEAYFLGMWAYLLNRRAIVVTSTRLLFLQIDSRNRVKQLRTQIRLDAIKKVSAGWLGSMTIKFHSGKSFVISGMPRKDQKVLREQIKSRSAALPESMRASTQKENLCPSCYTVIEGHPENCPSCSQEFVTPMQAGLRSLLLPGLGDRLLGHKFLSVIEMLGAVLAWLVVIGLAMAPEAGTEAEAASPESPVAVAAIMAVFIFLAVHVVDAFVTQYTARRGIYARLQK